MGKKRLWMEEMKSVVEVVFSSTLVERTRIASLASLVKNHMTLQNSAAFFPISTLVRPSAQANMASMRTTFQWATFFLLFAMDPLLLSRRKLQRIYLKLRELIGMVRKLFKI